MPAIDLDLLIESYENDYFTLAKKRFALYAKEAAQFHSDKSVDTLLYVICSQNVLGFVSRYQFSKMFKSLFYEKLNDPKFLLKYMSAMHGLIAERKDLKYESRAKVYYDNLSTYIDKVRNKNSDFQIKTAAEVESFVIDYMKKILMLYGQVSVSNGNTTITKVSNSISSSLMVKFAQAFFNFILIEDDDEETVIENTAPEDSKKNNVFGKLGHGIQKGFGQAVDAVAERNAQAKNKKEQNNQTKHLYRLITWLLFYKLCQEEAYLPEE